MNFRNFIGIDVSKKTLDFSLVYEGKQTWYHQTTNTVDGIRATLKILQKEFKISFKDSIFCMEHTGIYCNILLTYLNKKKAAIWLESAARIKGSEGLQRGKDDATDSFLIAMYAYKSRDQFKLWEPPRKEIQQLKALVGLRSRLIDAKVQLETPIKEQNDFIERSIQKQLLAVTKNSIEAIEKDIKKVDKQIKDIIDNDNDLKNNYELITSISGIGPVTAVYVMVATNEFKNFTEAKRFACHAGVVPFPYRSGTSIKGKNRISHKADKKLKRLLHLSAVTAIRIKGELQDYYKRKVEEGKHKMAVLNAIRNKLILRIFAVVQRNTKYDKTYAYALV